MFILIIIDASEFRYLGSIACYVVALKSQGPRGRIFKISYELYTSQFVTEVRIS